MWEPEKAADTSVASNKHLHKLSPYTDMQLKGKVLATVVGGRMIHMFGVLSKRPCGAVIDRQKP